ncbi:MAG: cation:dicarboxylase symporter family transporter, partial [Stenotrophomonas sp.]
MTEAATTRKKLPLHWKMGIGFALGLVLGLIVHAAGPGVPGLTDVAKGVMAWVTTPLSGLFLNLIFMLIVPLIFSALIMGVSEMGDIRALGRIGWKTLAYTVLLSGIAVGIGLVLVNVLKPGAGVDPQVAAQMLSENAERSKEIVAGIHETPKGMDMLLSIVPSNVLQAASDNGAILSLMFFALMFGIGMVLSDEEKVAPLRRAVEGVFEVSMTLINLVIRLA